MLVPWFWLLPLVHVYFHNINLSIWTNAGSDATALLRNRALSVCACCSSVIGDIVDGGGQAPPHKPLQQAAVGVALRVPIPYALQMGVQHPQVLLRLRAACVLHPPLTADRPCDCM